MIIPLYTSFLLYDEAHANGYSRKLTWLRKTKEVFKGLVFSKCINGRPKEQTGRLRGPTIQKIESRGTSSLLVCFLNLLFVYFLYYVYYY